MTGCPDDLLIQRLNEEQNYYSDIAFMDQAKMQFETDEEYKNALQLSKQKVDEEIAESEYRLNVYKQAMADDRWIVWLYPLQR